MRPPTGNSSPASHFTASHLGITQAILLAALSLASGCEGCGSRQTLYDHPLAAEAGIDADELEGEATWYGERHHGRTTASGEPFDMYDFTAAHKTLPFGTIVRVTRQDTLQSVVVRINDRGPYGRGRIIDLSRAAAEEIDLIRPGHMAVFLEILAWPGEEE